jgi:hypothetical protein
VRYPSELPVFRINGCDYEVRPCVSFDDVTHGGLVAIVGSWKIVWSIDFPLAFRNPRTRAARELLAWSRQ